MSDPETGISRVMTTIAHYPHVHPDQIAVEADAATVTLRGQVEAEARRERAERLAYDIAGVSRVWNRLRVPG